MCSHGAKMGVSNWAQNVTLGGPDVCGVGSPRGPTSWGAHRVCTPYHANSGRFAIHRGWRWAWWCGKLVHVKHLQHGSLPRFRPQLRICSPQGCCRMGAVHVRWGMRTHGAGGGEVGLEMSQNLQLVKINKSTPRCHLPRLLLACVQSHTTGAYPMHTGT